MLFKVLLRGIELMLFNRFTVFLQPIHHSICDMLILLFLLIPRVILILHLGLVLVFCVSICGMTYMTSLNNKYCICNFLQ